MQLARTLRAESSVPIIIVTGKQDEADRVMGLEFGADDYVTKPFSRASSSPHPRGAASLSDGARGASAARR